MTNRFNNSPLPIPWIELAESGALLILDHRTVDKMLDVSGCPKPYCGRDEGHDGDHHRGSARQRTPYKPGQRGARI